MAPQDQDVVLRCSMGEIFGFSVGVLCIGDGHQYKLVYSIGRQNKSRAATNDGIRRGISIGSGPEEVLGRTCSADGLGLEDDELENRQVDGQDVEMREDEGNPKNREETRLQAAEKKAGGTEGGAGILEIPGSTV